MRDRNQIMNETQYAKVNDDKTDFIVFKSKRNINTGESIQIFYATAI